MKKTLRPGISIFIFVILISLFMLVCTGVWKTTTYLVDFACQKQVYVQNCYAAEGVMRWVIKYIKDACDTFEDTLTQQGDIICTVRDWPFTVEHLKHCEIIIKIQRVADDTRHIEICFIQERTVHGKAQCKLVKKTKDATDIPGGIECEFIVYDWQTTG